MTTTFETTRIGGKVAGYSPQEVWHLCGGYACGNCAEKELDEEDDAQ